MPRKKNTDIIINDEPEPIINNENDEDFPSLNDSLDKEPEQIRMELAYFLSKKLYKSGLENQSMQVSRLTGLHINTLSFMKMFDEIIGFPLYESYSEPFRIQRISLEGKGRTEAINLVSATVKGDSELHNAGMTEKRTLFGRIRNYFST